METAPKDPVRSDIRQNSRRRAFASGMGLQIGALALLALCSSAMGAEVRSQTVSWKSIEAEGRLFWAVSARLPDEIPENAVTAGLGNGDAGFLASAFFLRPWEGRVPALRRTAPSVQRAFAKPATRAVLGFLQEMRTTSREFAFSGRKVQRRQVLSYVGGTVFALAGQSLQANGKGADAPAVLDASHAETGGEAGAASDSRGGGDSYPGGRVDYGGYRDFVPSSPASLGLEERVSRIEGYLPHLATKADLHATEAKLEGSIAALRSEVDAKLREQFRDFLWFNGSMLAGLFAAFALFVKLTSPSGSLVLATVRTSPEEGGAEPSPQAKPGNGEPQPRREKSS